MQLIRDIHASKMETGRPVISFEFFPPKTPESERSLLQETLPALMAANPDFFSVTYGAGGSTRDKTLELAHEIQSTFQLPAMAHLTCVGSTEDQIRHYVDRARALDIRNILALRGDPPGGVGEFQRTDGGFEFSWQLVQFLRGLGGFSIGTAGFPEGHTACKAGKYVDWQRLKAKVDYGADFVVTQLFFDNRDFFEFEAFLRQQGVQVPICAGILPITSAAQIKRFTALCGASLPPKVLSALSDLGDDEAKVVDFGINYAIEQCRELVARGVRGIHFYTLNKSTAVRRILDALNLRG